MLTRQWPLQQCPPDGSGRRMSRLGGIGGDRGLDNEAPACLMSTRQGEVA